MTQSYLFELERRTRDLDQLVTKYRDALENIKKDPSQAKQIADEALYDPLRDYSSKGVRDGGPTPPASSAERAQERVKRRA